MTGPHIISLPEIEHALGQLELLPAIEEAFVAYSAGRAVVPPVGELLFSEPPGDVHIKYGYLKCTEHYVIKVASGFYDNPKLGLPSYDGLMLVFAQATGQLRAVLLVEGHLTNLRTAVAGAVAAKHLAPARVERIGIFGTGCQARLQLEQLAQVTPCRDALVWGRRSEAALAYCRDLAQAGFRVKVCSDPAEVAAGAQLIVTTTPSRTPLFPMEAVQPGTHITAVGSDTPGKQELPVGLLARADRVVVDSRSQCSERGELAHALSAGLLAAEAAVELGAVIAGNAPGRLSEQDITVADLTGVAVQDIAIATAVCSAL